MRTLAFAAAILLSATAAFAAEISGSYKMQGQGPDGSAYSGTVTVKKTGDSVYEVVWLIGGQKFIGTGIGGDDALAVAYKSGSETGIALYAAKDNDIVGAWTYTGGTKLGSEVWKRR